MSYSDSTAPVTYVRDGFGNVTKRSDTTTYGFDALNRLTSRTVGAHGIPQLQGFDAHVIPQPLM